MFLLSNNAVFMYLYCLVGLPGSSWKSSRPIFKITSQVFMLLNELLNGRFSHPDAILLVSEAGQRFVMCLADNFFPLNWVLMNHGTDSFNDWGTNFWPASGLWHWNRVQVPSRSYNKKDLITSIIFPWTTRLLIINTVCNVFRNFTDYYWFEFALLSLKAKLSIQVEWLIFRLHQVIPMNIVDNL